MTTIGPIQPDNQGFPKENNNNGEAKSKLFDGLWSFSDYDNDGQFSMDDIKSSNALFKHRVGLYLEKLIPKGSKFADVKDKVISYLGILESDFGERPAQSTIEIASKKSNEYFESTVDKFFEKEFAASEDIEKMVKNHYKCIKQKDGSRVYIDKQSNRIMYKFNPNGERIRFYYEEGNDKAVSFTSVNPYELPSKTEYNMNKHGVYAKGFGGNGYKLTDDYQLIPTDYWGEK